MSKERALRRAERERESAVRAAARAAEAERAERRAARCRALAGRLPRRTSRQSGILAERRRRQAGATVALLLAVNVLVWVFFDDWAARAMVAVVSPLAAPVLHTMLFRR
jgi:Flp pilus assembly protein TadB